jgi:hypothetical protein
MAIPGWEDVLAAHERINPYVLRTPVLESVPELMTLARCGG